MVTFEMDTSKFNVSMNKFIKQSDIATGKVIRKVAYDLLGGILGGLPRDDFKLKSKKFINKYGRTTVTGRHPVDAGRARAGWYISIQGLSPSKAGAFNWESRVKTRNPEAIAKGKRSGSFVDATNKLYDKYVELINAVHYIIYLEYGWSKQAPAGMVRITMKNMKGQLSGILDEEFLEEWNDIGF